MDDVTIAFYLAFLLCILLYDVVLLPFLYGEAPVVVGVVWSYNLRGEALSWEWVGVSWEKKLELKNVAKSGKSQNDKMSVYKGFGQRLRQCG